MKITCNRRDEILKQKAEWEAERDARQAKYDEQEQRFRQAEYDVTSVVENEIKSQLSKFTALQFDVRVDRARFGGEGLYIRVVCNENNKFSEDSALSWSYQASFEDGQVKKETSSWSGLQATTEKQMESLTQTLEAIRYLNSVDWSSLLNKEMPNYKDYFTETNPSFDRNEPDFDKMLMEADIEECIGKDILIKGTNSIDSRGYFRGTAYYMILKETPTQYLVAKIPGYIVDSDEYDTKTYVEKNKGYADRVKKENLIRLLNQPIETVEV